MTVLRLDRGVREQAALNVRGSLCVEAGVALLLLLPSTVLAAAFVNLHLQGEEDEISNGFLVSGAASVLMNCAGAGYLAKDLFDYFCKDGVADSRLEVEQRRLQSSREELVVDETTPLTRRVLPRSSVLSACSSALNWV